MFGLWGRLTRGGYTLRALIRIGIFAGITAAFPYLLMSYLKVSGCGRVGGACGALGLVVSIYAKPAVFLLFVVSVIGISAKRFRDASYPALLGLLPALIFVGDWQFAVVLGSPWSVPFVLGVLKLKLPWLLLSGLAMMLMLASLPSREDEDSSPIRLMVYSAAALAGVLAAFSIIRLWASVAMMKAAGDPAAFKFYFGLVNATHYQWLAMAFCALAALIAIYYLFVGGSSTSSTPYDDGTPEPKGPQPNASYAPISPPRLGSGAPRAAFGRRGT